MDDYIERGFALDVVKRTSGDYVAAWAEIAHAPAADVAPVVRCGECQNCLIDLSERAHHICMANRIPKQVTLEDFCSFGVKR